MNQTRYFTIATAGHVDHGKTSVLRALTGIDPDRLKEEKLRQMTIDLGFAHLELKGRNGEEVVVGFVDVPGHGKFLKNMLAGVGGIDMALLVVAADEGPMPQTVAHVKILSLLAVKRAVVVLTKIDLADVHVQEESLSRLQSLLQQYDVEALAVVPVSCTQKSGFDELSRKLQDALTFLLPDKPGPLYLPIDRVFTKSGYGLVVTGTLVRGSVRVGESVFVGTGQIKARVRGLETFGRTLESARAGQRLAVNLSFREHTALSRGQAILGEELEPSSSLVVQFVITRDSEDGTLRQSLAGQPIRLYHGTAEVSGTVRWLESREETLVGQISLDQPLIVEPGDRFIVRYGEHGITGGVVLCTARPRWLTRPKLIALLEALLNSDYQKAIGAMLDASPQRAIRADLVNCILPQQRRGPLINELITSGAAVRLSEHLATRDSMDYLATKVATELAKQVGEHADSGVTAESLRAKILPGVDRSVFQALMKILAERGQLVRQGDRILPFQRKSDFVQKNVEQAALEVAIMDILSKYYCLEIDELVKQSGRDRKAVDAALVQLVKEMRSSIVNYEFVGSAEKINEAHNLLAKLWQVKGDISPAEFRDALGTTRKYAMALLAYFDDHGITRRLSNSRVLLKKPKTD